jgi:hypothetical protein
MSWQSALPHADRNTTARSASKEFLPNGPWSTFRAKRELTMESHAAHAALLAEILGTLAGHRPAPTPAGSESCR